MYVEKEKELMDAMRQNGFELFDGNSDDAYDTLERIFMAFVDYANCVIRMQVMVPIWRNRYEGEDLRDKIQEIDHTRRIYHEAAISSLVKLNRLLKCTDYLLIQILTLLTVMKSLILSVPGSLKSILTDSPGVWMQLYLEKIQNIHYTV